MASPLPSAVTAPRRSSWPSSTRATSRTWMGTPCCAATAMDSMSAMVVASPIPWTSWASPPRTTRPPPTLALLRCSARATSSRCSSYFSRSSGSNDDVELLLVAAPGVDLGGAGDLEHLRADDPVVQRAQLLGRELVALDQVLEDLAQAGRDGAEGGAVDAVGELDGLEALADDLAGEVDVGGVVEGGGDLGEAELRDGADTVEAGEAADDLLDREGDLALDLERGQRGGDGVDGDLNRGRVRVGVQREVPERDEACGDEAGGGEQHHAAVAQRQVDDAVEHVYFAPAVSTSQQPAPMLSRLSSVRRR
jgi:hypothetical protein